MEFDLKSVYFNLKNVDFNLKFYNLIKNIRFKSLKMCKVDILMVKEFMGSGSSYFRSNYTFFRSNSSYFRSDYTFFRPNSTIFKYRILYFQYNFCTKFGNFICNM